MGKVDCAKRKTDEVLDNRLCASIASKALIETTRTSSDLAFGNKLPARPPDAYARAFGPLPPIGEGQILPIQMFPHRSGEGDRLRWWGARGTRLPRRLCEAPRNDVAQTMSVVLLLQ